MTELLPVDVQNREDQLLGAAWRRCEAARPPGWFNGPTLFGYDTQDGGRSYVASITGPKPRMKHIADGPTPAAALDALTAALSGIADTGGRNG